MDEIVKAAIRKWPNVPACYGWLGLSARGDWYLRDEATQNAGSFQSADGRSKGSKLDHTGLIEFISRNYQCDAAGNWYFQNGPQQVFVELEITPWIWRIESPTVLSFHSRISKPLTNQCSQDIDGRVYMQTDVGFGMIHSNDVPLAAEFIEQGIWRVGQKIDGDLGYLHHFCKSPLDKKRADVSRPSA